LGLIRKTNSCLA